jgi:pilus assembly protein Flp/PilA
MLQLLKRFVREEEGLETVEYAIIAGLIVVGIVTTIGQIGQWVGDKFNELNTDLQGSGT